MREGPCKPVMKPDVSKELSHEVNCYNCQKPATRQTKEFYGERPGEKYYGNLEIKSEIPRVGGDKKIYYTYVCYTGKFVMKFGNFCCGDCALVWANKEIEKRREKSRESRRCARSVATIGDAVSSDQKEKMNEMAKRSWLRN